MTLSGIRLLNTNIFCDILIDEYTVAEIGQCEIVEKKS